MRASACALVIAIVLAACGRGAPTPDPCVQQWTQTYAQQDKELHDRWLALGKPESSYRPMRPGPAERARIHCAGDAGAAP